MNEITKSVLLAVFFLFVSVCGWRNNSDEYYYTYVYKGGYQNAQGKFLSYEIEGGNRAKSVKKDVFEVEYEVLGKRYICSRLSWGGYTNAYSYGWLKEAYKTGIVDVYYVPDKPNVSVLDPTGTHGTITPWGVYITAACFGLAVVCALSSIVQLGIKKWRTQKSLAGRASRRS